MRRRKERPPCRLAREPDTESRTHGTRGSKQPPHTPISLPARRADAYISLTRQERENHQKGLRMVQAGLDGPAYPPMIPAQPAAYISTPRPWTGVSLVI